MHKVYETLRKLGIIDEAAVEEFFPKVRDREDVKVLRCKSSGLIFLDKIIPPADQYEKKDGLNYWKENWSEGRLVKDHLTISEDDERRYNEFHYSMRGKKILDIGCGMGGFLRLMRNEAQVHGIELMPGPREELCQQGIVVKKSFDEFEEQQFDFITLFHVFEHLDEPLEFLETAKRFLKPTGKIIIEVPHARDALITLYANEKFKAFTFWSQHIVLHTRSSLETFAREAGFKKSTVYGYQRYTLANHLYWLSQGKPGGHAQWAFLDDQQNHSYAASLKGIDATDTLIAIVEP